MSGKKTKILRQIEKNFKLNLVTDTHLIELGRPYFTDDDEGIYYLKYWYRDACFVKAMHPHLEDEELMPPSLAVILAKLDLLDYEAIFSHEPPDFL